MNTNIIADKLPCNINPEDVFRFDADTRTGFVYIPFVAKESDLSTLKLFELLEMKDSAMHKWLIRFCNCSSQDLIELVSTGYVTGQMMQGILQNRSINSDIALKNNAKWAGLTTDVMIANYLSYFEYQQIPSEDRLSALIGDKEHLYHPAFYKNQLNRVWSFWFGRNILTMLCDEETGRKYTHPGDAKPIYKIFVQGMGKDFEQYYEKENYRPLIYTKKHPEGILSKYRKYTYSQFMLKSPLLDRALYSFTDKFVIHAFELAIEKDLVYLDKMKGLTLEEKMETRRRARMNRGGLYDTVAGMSTIEELVELYNEEDRKIKKQVFLYLPN